MNCEYSTTFDKSNDLQLSQNELSLPNRVETIDSACLNAHFLSVELEKKLSDQFVVPSMPAREIWNKNYWNSKEHSPKDNPKSIALNASTVSHSVSTQEEKGEGLNFMNLAEDDSSHKPIDPKKRFSIRIIKMKKGKKVLTSNPINIISKALRDSNIDSKDIDQETSHNKVMLSDSLKCDKVKFQFQSIKTEICCTCKHSSCIKLYCDCFKNGLYCNGCNCLNCLNKLEFESLRKQSIDYIKEKRYSSIYSNSKQGLLKGCCCKNSSCKKNYCECFINNQKCSDKCRCINCLNQDR